MGDGTVGAYYSNFGPGHGLVMYRDVAGSIEVFEDPDGSIPIGTARCIGWDAAGSAVWRLIVHDEEFEDPWVIVDREFLSTRPDWRDLYRSDLDSAPTRPRVFLPFPRRAEGAPSGNAEEHSDGPATIDPLNPTGSPRGLKSLSEGSIDLTPSRRSMIDGRAPAGARPFDLALL